MHNPLYRQWRLVQFKRNMSLCWCRVFLPASLGSECSVWVLLCNRETGSPDPSPPPRWGLQAVPWFGPQGTAATHNPAPWALFGRGSARTWLPLGLCFPCLVSVSPTGCCLWCLFCVSKESAYAPPDRCLPLDTQTLDRYTCTDSIHMYCTLTARSRDIRRDRHRCHISPKSLWLRRFMWLEWWWRRWWGGWGVAVSGCWSGLEFNAGVLTF